MTLPLHGAVAVLAALLAGIVAGLVTPVVLRALPEPTLAGGEEKVPYRALPRVPLAWGSALWATALTTATMTSLPPTAWAPYVVVALVGSVGCVIDAATTWLPKRILHVGWVVTPVALAASTLASGWEAMALVRAVIGALLVGGLLRVAHALGGLGYSDVRLGLLTGGITAWLSWETLYLGLLLGTGLGAAWGAVHAVRHGRGTAFAYGPSLLFGPYLAVLVQSLTQ